MASGSQPVHPQPGSVGPAADAIPAVGGPIPSVPDVACGADERGVERQAAAGHQSVCRAGAVAGPAHRGVHDCRRRCSGECAAAGEGEGVGG